MQLAQVLQGVRSAGAGQFAQTGATNAMSNSILGSAPTFPQAFLQPQGFPQRVAASSNLLSGISQSAIGSASGSASNLAARTTTGQMLDLYYTSLCQPSFPNITENPASQLIILEFVPTVHLFAKLGESPWDVSSTLFARAIQPTPQSAATTRLRSV